MIYVYVDSLRMAHVQKELNAHTLSDPDEIKKGDTIIFPVLKKNQRKLELKKGTLILNSLEGYTLFLPFPYSFFKENNDVYYYMQDNKLADENAKLTGLGLMTLLGSLPLSMKDVHFDVIGYGKCGKAIVSLLDAMGMEYTIIRHNNHNLTENVRVVSMQTYKENRKGDVLINTAPYNQLKKEDYVVGEASYVIDISTEKCFSEKDLPTLSILIHPGSLPNRYFAYSSAKLIADYVKGKQYEK